ncbi:hypothetical protein [Photobacterium leiognathi]|uniref:hypothetical protein n=1 Tax=Photobacterium leiognathi TaxID=553611 RepID=UPI00020880DE|nr:hypothetical protein [Photobacterium leiognathi]GAA03246.1 putative uncharacterized protein [Photobacterium leiognathi subsp. mandapamensis svers.1.1.]
MSSLDINTLKKLPLVELPNQPIELVIAWLRNQPDFIGEAVAKACYQQIANA